MPRIAQGLLLSAMCAALGMGVEPTGAAAAWSEPCTVGSLSVSSSFSPVATAYTPGTWVQRPAAVSNTTGADLTDARFDFVIGPDNQKIGARPSVRWNIDSGTWHALSFYHTNIGMPVWKSDDNALPTMTDASDHTMLFSVAFPAGATQGSYFSQLNIGSASCGLTWLGGTLSLNFGYLPSYAPKSTPAKKAPQPRVSHAKVVAPPPPASASPLPSLSPSPSVSPLPLASPSFIVSSALAQALATTNSASDSGLPESAAVGIAAVAVLALISPILLRRRRLRGTSQG